MTVTGEPMLALSALRLGKKKGFTLLLQTLPDHSILTFVPGLGHRVLHVRAPRLVERGDE